jgi:hypothetical protein
MIRARRKMRCSSVRIGTTPTPTPTPKAEAEAEAEAEATSARHQNRIKQYLLQLQH